MKHIITIISALVFVSAAVLADEAKKHKSHKNKSVSIAPFAWGDPDQNVLEIVVEVNFVPVAPFVWGSPEEIAPVAEETKLKNLTGLVAAFIWGNLDELISIDDLRVNAVFSFESLKRF